MEAVIERVRKCTWRPLWCELRDALGGRDRVNLEIRGRDRASLEIHFAGSDRAKLEV